MSKPALSQDPEVVLQPPHLVHTPGRLGSKTGRKAIVRTLYSPLDRNHNALLKRSVDLLVSVMVFILVFPWLFPLMALIIRMDSKGPVLFIQKRVKRNGDLFSCIKFRTMRSNEGADSQPAIENDVRITRVGKFLRRHHLDELPQMLNVLLGEMSLIGPRPYMVTDDQKFERMMPDYHSRYIVKPGITGMAQVCGLVGYVAELNDLERRLEKDTYYIQHWSLALDLKIFLKTFGRMLKTGS